MSVTTPTPVAVVFAALLLAACGGSGAAGGTAGSPDDATSSPPAAGTCLEGTPDCQDADLDGGSEEPTLDQTFDEETARRDAASLLGETETDVLALWGDVRLGRHGDDHLMLTEDYVLGRKTIATEDDGTGTFRVVEVTIELEDGPEVLTADG